MVIIGIWSVCVVFSELFLKVVTWFFGGKGGGVRIKGKPSFQTFWRGLFLLFSTGGFPKEIVRVMKVIAQFCTCFCRRNTRNCTRGCQSSDRKRTRLNSSH